MIVKSILFILLNLIIVLTYQNCGQTGGDSAFGFLGSSSTDCSANPISCSQNGIGDVENLQLGSPTKGTSLRASYEQDSIELQGTCDSSGFSRTKIYWELYLTKDPTNSSITKKLLATSVLDRTTNPEVGCVLNSYKVLVRGFHRIAAGSSTVISSKNLRIGAQYSIVMKIFGVDATGGIMQSTNAAKSMKTIGYTAVDGIAPPVLDSRILSAFADNDTWKKNPLYPETTKSRAPRLKIYDNSAGSLVSLKDIAGLCDYRAGASSQIRLVLEESLGDPLFLSQPKKIVYTSTCRPFEIATSPYIQDFKNLYSGAYKGYFLFDGTSNNPLPEIPFFVKDSIGVQFANWYSDASGVLTNARHFNLRVEQDDPISGMVVTFNGPLVITRFDFSGTGLGRKWTVPLARQALAQATRAITFRSSRDVTSSEGIAERDVNSFITRMTTSGRYDPLLLSGVGYGFRTEMVWRIAAGSGVLGNVFNPVKEQSETIHPNSGFQRIVMKVPDDRMASLPWASVSRGSRLCNLKNQEKGLSENLRIYGLGLNNPADLSNQSAEVINAENNPSSLLNPINSTLQTMTALQAIENLKNSGNWKMLEAVQKLSLCFEYWMWFGFHGQRAYGESPAFLTEGVLFTKVQASGGSEASSARSGDWINGDSLQSFVSDIASFSAQSRFAGYDPTATTSQDAAKAREYWQGITQLWINKLMDRVVDIPSEIPTAEPYLTQNTLSCSVRSGSQSPSHLFWGGLLDTLKLNDTLPGSKSADGYTALTCQDLIPTDNTGVSWIPNRPVSQAYTQFPPSKTYDPLMFSTWGINPEKGSTGANGSIIFDAFLP